MEGINLCTGDHTSGTGALTIQGQQDAQMQLRLYHDPAAFLQHADMKDG